MPESHPRQNEKQRGNGPTKNRSFLVRALRILKRRYHGKIRDSDKEHADNEQMMAHWTRVVGKFTVILAACALVNIVILLFQLNDNQQARLPFVSVSEVALYARREGYEVVLVWENSGGTEARDVASKAVWFETATPHQRHEIPTETFFLAPHGRTDASRFLVDSGLIGGFDGKQRSFTIEWRAAYCDKFGGNHRTHQGWILDRIDDNPAAMQSNDRVNAVWKPKPRFTCVDEECKD